ncbi:uracil phosphoribosyltransferase homolog isoform X3 [Varroa destructor]|uniref:Uracil phosphoribosyltransferase homolog n=1 Tax=Varroa destructor TaxID=109461 RepID=A0A7M7K1M1_VARDE|nr:uracil phosphoribosyltransferase homolog isoform X3 [Varroa destructor]
MERNEIDTCMQRTVKMPAVEAKPDVVPQEAVSAPHDDEGKEDVLMSRNVKLIPITNQTRELQTIIREKNTSRGDFVFYADRLIRMVVEEGLNHFPYTPQTVITPIGAPYEGLRFVKGGCGVSIVRSGEAMEKGLRDCCRSIRIGKILIQSNEDTHEAKVVYAKFPEDIARRRVLLMYPIMSTGNTIIKATKVLLEHGVQPDNIILLNLFCTPKAVRCVTKAFPQLTILTTEIHPVAPNHFGQKYFGTD